MFMSDDLKIAKKFFGNHGQSRWLSSRFQKSSSFLIIVK